MEENPLAALMSASVYTVREVLNVCHLDRDHADMMIMRMIAKQSSDDPEIALLRIIDDPIPALYRITGTGAEFQHAYETGSAVIQVCRELQTMKHVPGLHPFLSATPCRQYSQSTSVNSGRRVRTIGQQLKISVSQTTKRLPLEWQASLSHP